ncbi:MAG: type I DNA topoisomerase [bacterium]
MSKSLVIVESPAKAKTINKYLGNNFIVKATVGHIKDLPKSKLSVDIKNNFKPVIKVIKGKETVVAEIKQAAQKADNVYLATDPDREGEAISQHIAEEIKVPDEKVYRVLFNEITKKAVNEAITNPGRINTNKVNAQLARRILDRIVGYQISPLLWQKVKRGLSAGRVQSVAVRLICDRETEIEAFKSKEYWSITALLAAQCPPDFEARLIKVNNEKIEISNEKETNALLTAIEGKDWVVKSIKKSEKLRRPEAPFITSRLQQEAARKLNFTAKKTMQVAQKLYEGIDLGEQGTVGLITYMRTDSTRISSESQQEARLYISERFGDKYLPKKPNIYPTKKAAQDAHEAIRPTSVYNEPEKLGKFLSKDELKLYKLIWDRYIASQMEPAILDLTTVDILVGNCLFRANGSIIRFTGFMKIYIEGIDNDRRQETRGIETKEENQKNDLLPGFTEGEILKLLKLDPKQHFTQPPPRYTEASLVKELEEKGIGRPSTYATIMGTIVDRSYVEKKENKFFPTDLGRIVNNLLIKHFARVLDITFTADMETKLDQVEEGGLNWISSLNDFYQSFSSELEKATKEMEDIKTQTEETDYVCEKCGQKMVIRWGKNGHFLSCSAYPNCKNTKEINRDESGKVEIVEPEAINETCEKCGSPMAVKSGRFGKFLACSNYPKCKNTKNFAKDTPGDPINSQQEISKEKCDKCGAEMVIKQGRYGKFLACSDYPTCKATKPMTIGIKCPENNCDGNLVARRAKQRVFYGCSNYPRCKFSTWEKPSNKSCPQCKSFLVEKFDKKSGTSSYKCSSKDCNYVETQTV